MLRNLGLAVFVVCIAAFASGCGGGGGGGSAEEMPPVMECPQGQVGTYPDCMEPGPTDEQRIADAKEAIAGIVNEANGIEQEARSAVTAVESNADATNEQIANARAEGNAALDALREIVRASGVANSATTPAAAEGAVVSARAALGRLNVARTAAVGIQSAVEAVANLREQEAETERLATNGSSLIQHVRDNKLVYDDVLKLTGSDGTNDPLTVAKVDSSNLATYPKDDTSGPTRVVGERGVTVTASGTTLTSGASGITTSALSGTSRLPHGFDLKNGATFVNAYTDITKTRVVRTRVALTGDDQYENQDVPDGDYLLAGIWLASNAIEAFAYGSQALNDTLPNQCGVTEVAGASTDTLTRACVEPTGFNSIAGFVADGKNMTATYRGDANGAYLASGAMSYFEADVTLTAEFRNPTGGTTNGEGSIQGEVTNIVAAGKSIAGSIELQKHTFEDAIEAGFGGEAVGVVEGKSYSGNWKGQFFGQKFVRGSKTATIDSNNPARTTTTTYSAQAPGSVAGTFYTTQQSNPAGSTAFIGAFGAHR